VDIHDSLDELSALIEGARSVPMSASCVVNRADALALVDRIRASLPGTLQEAEGLLSRRDDVLAQARQEAEGILDEAHAERMRLVSRTEVMAQATREGRRVVGVAEEEAAQMRQEIDDYVDAKLANFEIILAKTQEAVHKGREKIAGRRAVDDLTPLDSLAHEDDDASEDAAPAGGSATGPTSAP
jgi:cell division septum initiation protein DivIVA